MPGAGGTFPIEEGARTTLSGRGGAQTGVRGLGGGSGPDPKLGDKRFSGVGGGSSSGSTLSVYAG